MSKPVELKDISAEEKQSNFLDSLRQVTSVPKTELDLRTKSTKKEAKRGVKTGKKQSSPVLKVDSDVQIKA